jgi:uncharacterized protein
MISDPWFYLTAIIAVLIVGIAKGGLAGGIGIIGVPLMALTIGPVQAAAIMLPILMLMDVLALRVYWRQWDNRNLLIIIPGAILGTILGLLTFKYLTPDHLRLLIGVIAVGYALNWFLSLGPKAARSASRVRGTFWSTLSGFTSFSVHAGGPPIHVYLLPQQLGKTRFQATTVAFFFLVNWFKLGPYAWLGLLDWSNLGMSLLLAPLAPVGIFLGSWLHRRIDERMFVMVVYVSLLGIGLKLIYDGWPF